ncbi:MAG: ATP-binding domain-containing protein [Candidatus Scalindua sp.]|nr:ATP-binding domain-containing protein [Candidatus Scalindua sp.]
MPVDIIRGTNKKPVASDALANFFETHDEFEGQIFLGYPIIGTAEGRFAIDAIWLTPTKGIIVFDLVEGLNVGEFQDRQDEAANFLEAKLRAHRELISRRKLLVPIHTLTFAPALSHSKDDTVYPLSTQNDLPKSIQQINDWQIEGTDIFRKTLSAIQSISTIRKSRTKRQIKRIDSRGAKLKRLEDSIATLDAQQGKAVVETVEGVQRIRGLAGSGKTIVLALKAAYLHAQHPDWRIAVTFNTRSLKGQFRRLINTFCIEQTGEEPDWEKIRIVNAWGAPGKESRNGLYYEFCKVHDVAYYDFQSAKNTFQGENAFAGACNASLGSAKETKATYDAILVDEAQDFPPVFLKMCYEILTEDKRLVYAYDELQNLSGESLPPPEEIFGNKPDGSPFVQFDSMKPRRDILLKKCYRNSRPVLVTAHALGFGIYREPSRGKKTGLVQMFDHSGLWEEVGYRVKDGRLMEGENVVLERTNETSPSFLEEHSSINDLVQFHCFKSEEEQSKWLVEEVQKNIKNDELRCDDIIAINTDPISTRNKVGPIRKRLFEVGINSHLAGVDTDPDIFFQTATDSITFTGIYRAKGNEAGMVYIINAQDCHSSMFNLASIRNRLFTAITRSKAWVRILGVGEAMDKLVEEFNKLNQKHFELHFKYPTEEERKRLKIIHRDTTEQERKRLSERNKSLANVLKDLENGKINLEDLDENMIEQFKELLSRKS